MEIIGLMLNLKGTDSSKKDYCVALPTPFLCVVYNVRFTIQNPQTHHFLIKIEKVTHHIEVEYIDQEQTKIKDFKQNLQPKLVSYLPSLSLPRRRHY